MAISSTGVAAEKWLLDKGSESLSRGVAILVYKSCLVFLCCNFVTYFVLTLIVSYYADVLSFQEIAMTSKLGASVI